MKKVVLLMIVAAAFVGVGCKKMFVNDGDKIPKRKFEKYLVNKEWKYEYIKGDSTGLSTGPNSASYDEISFRSAFNGTIKFLDNGDFIHNGTYYGTYFIQYGTSRIDLIRGEGINTPYQIIGYGINQITEDRLELYLSESSSVVFTN